jgi:hypothetical protein
MTCDEDMATDCMTCDEDMATEKVFVQYLAVASAISVVYGCVIDVDGRTQQQKR